MSGFELESMAGVFLGTLEFSWGSRAKSPQIVANKIDRLDAGLRDMLLPMVATRQILLDDIEDRFAREVDVDGNPWKELSKDYKSTKERTFPGQTILRKDDSLFNAVTDPAAYPIRGNSMFVNTANFPVYWRIHDRGGKAGKNVTIPKRSYLGMSEQAGFAAIDVFDEWIGGLLDIIIGPATGVAMERGALGRIKSRIGLGRPTGRIAPIGLGDISPSAFSGL